jgi:translocation and assembly module TamB
MATSEPTATAPPKPRSKRPASPRGKALRRTLLAVTVLLLLVAAGIGFIGYGVRTEAGNAWLLSRVPGLTASGVRGTFSGGPFEVARLEYEADGLKVAIDGLSWRDLRWRWRPQDGSLLGLVLVEPQARRVEVHTGPPTPNAPPLKAPTDLRLPVEVEIQGLKVGVLQIDAQAPLSDLQASLHLGDDNGKVHRLSGLRLTLDGTGQAQAAATVKADAPIEIQAAVNASSVADAANPWQASATVKGPLARLDTQATLRSGTAREGEPGAGAVDVTATVAPFAPWPLAALAANTKDLDLAALAPGLPVTRLTGNASIASSGFDQPVQADIEVRNALPGRWDQQRLPVQSVVLGARGVPSDRSTLEFNRFEVQLGGAALKNGTLPNAGRVQGSGRWQQDTLTLDTVLTALRPAQLDSRAAAMTLGGPLSLVLRGLPSPSGESATPPPDTLHAEAKAQLDGRLEGSGTPAVRVQLSAEADRKKGGLTFDVKQLQASAGAARAQLTAQGAVNEAGAWQLKSRGQLASFDTVPWFPGPDGSAWRRGPHRVNAAWNADLSGPPPPAKAADPMALLLALRGQATLDLKESQLAGVPLQGKLALRGAGGGNAQSTLSGEVQAAGNRLVFDGAAGRVAASDRWRADLQAPALAALAPIAGLSPALQAWVPRAGSASLQATVDGRWPALRSQGTLRTNDVLAGDLKLGRVEAIWQGANDANAPLSLRVEAADLASGEQRIDTLLAKLEGSLRSHRLEVDAASPVRPPSWVATAPARATPTAAAAAGAASVPAASTSAAAARPLAPSATPPTAATPLAGTALRLRAEGNWLAQESAWQGRIGELLVRDRSGNGAPLVSAANLQGRVRLDADGALSEASAQPGRIELLGAALRWTEARWQAGVPAGQNQAARTPRIDLNASLEPLRIAPWLLRFQPDMRWGGDLALAGKFTVRSAGAFQADVVLERAGGDLNLTDDAGVQALGLTDLRLALSAEGGTWHITQAVAGANLGVLAGSQTLRLSPQANWPLPDTPLEGVLEWRVDNLGIWTPFVPPAWRLGGQLRTSATFGGRFGAPQYTGEMVGTGLSVRNLLEGVDVKEGDLALSLRGTEARIERFRFKGGDGKLELTGGASLGAAPAAQVRVEASRFQLLGRLDRRIVASGSADLALQANSLKLDGRFTVDEGLIDFTRGDAPSLDGDVTVVRRKGEPPIHPDQLAKQRAAAPASGPPKNINVSLQVDLGEKLALRGRGIDTQLRGQVAITTPDGKLAINGSVRTEAGTYAAYGQKLEIERGIITFTGGVENPRLDIVAIRPNLDIPVGVQVGGNALNPRVRLFSEPDMADMDKLSWLLLGRAPDGLARTDTALLQRAAMALLSGEGPGATDGILKSIGIDELSVSQNEDGEVKETVVTVGKQISRRLYLGYEHGVNATAGSWQLIYRIAQRLTVRAQTGAETALDVIWTWRWN